MKDIIPTNKEGNWDGYCKGYWSSGKLWHKGVWVNGKRYGYHVEYWASGSVKDDGTGYFLDHKKVSRHNKKGYCYIWERKEII